MGKYMPTEEEAYARDYCIKRGFYVSPYINKFKFCLNINGKNYPESYKKVEIWQEMYKCYLIKYKQNDSKSHLYI